MILRRLKEKKNNYELFLFDATISFEAFNKFSVDNQKFLEEIQSSFKKNGL
jgi:cyclopropane fatty-acyl-phospholipid synthase-like methyltransferase